MQDEPVRHGIIAIDICRFGRPEWTDPIRARLRSRLHHLVDLACRRAELSQSATTRSDTGDGLLLLVHGEVATTRLLSLAADLADGIARDNRQTGTAARLRLRIVVHTGELLHDPHGHTGEALNHACRVLDADATRAALTSSPHADAVLVASDEVYQGVIRHAYGDVDPAAWRPVHVHVKETSTRAWAHFPGLAAQPDLPEVVAGPRVGFANLPVPRELPCAPAHFTGRVEDLAMLLGLLGSGQPSGNGRGRPAGVAVIDGMAGIGKSALAVHAAHQVADAFPDGQLYLDLHGATPGLAPLEPIAALDRLLQSLGVAAGQLPSDLDAAAARWRSLAADRRLLLVLDNAATVAQVVPLLPAGPTCAVLITSRAALPALGGATRLHLGTFPPAEAVELLAKLAGTARVTAEPGAAARVAAQCGYLPLALRLAGARLARRPAWPVRRLADRLGDRLGEVCRLDELRDGDVSVRASLHLSYQELTRSSDPTDRAAARAFRLLGLLEVPEVGVPIAARLLDRSDAHTESALERLVDAQLLQTPAAGRYRFHDLVRLYAAELVAGQDPDPQCRAALARVLDCYLATARHASHLLHPWDRRRAGSDSDRAGALPLPDRPAARGWLGCEQANLVALIRQATSLPDHLAVRGVALTVAIAPMLGTRSQYRDLETLGGLVAPVARRLGDHHGYALLLLNLGHARWRLGRVDDAPAPIRDALAAFRAVGDDEGQGRALNALAEMHGERGRWRSARRCLERALRLARAAGDRLGEVAALGNLGEVAQEVGDLEAAIGYAKQSLAIAQELGDRYTTSVALASLGTAALRQGRLAAAAGYCEQAIDVAREVGDGYIEAFARSERAEVDRQAGHPGPAVSGQRRAAATAQGVGSRNLEALALHRLGLALDDLGRRHEARASWRAALVLYEDLGRPQASDLRRLLDQRAMPHSPSADGGQ